MTRESLATELVRARVAPGEPYVWLTAMGLAVGLLMVAGLLAIIVANGLPVFWPARIDKVELAAGVKNPVPGASGEDFFGRLVQKRVKRTPILEPDGSLASNQKELQFFVGNREVNGAAFVYVDARDVLALTQPLDIWQFERMEFGVALGIPLSIEMEGKPPVSASSPDFVSTLKSFRAKADKLRSQIYEIEKVKIGRISARLNELRIHGGREEEKASLEEQFQKLAAQARSLRQEQTASVLKYQTPEGREVSLSAGQFIDAFQPNALTLPERIVRFLHNIWLFLVESPREANTEGGIFPAIFGTFVMTLLMSIAVMPFGVVAAVYLREYAHQGFFVRSVRIAVNNLAGVPSIVFGVFGLGFFVYFVGGTVDRTFFPEYLPTPTFGTGGIFWAALTLALMTVPVMIVATEEAIAAVPRGMKEGSLACGASKWQTIQRIVLPASLPGILTGLILAMARGAGEVAPLMLVGVVKLAPSLPLDSEFPFIHLERKFMHLGFHIYDLGFQSPDSEAARPMVFATTLLLILLVVVLNLTAILLREHLRKKYSTGAF